MLLPETWKLVTQCLKLLGSSPQNKAARLGGNKRIFKKILSAVVRNLQNLRACFEALRMLCSDLESVQAYTIR